MIEEFLKKIAQCLDKEQIPYMIIGGQAVLLYGRPRLTRDIDITLGVDTDKYQLVAGVCRKLNLTILPENSEVFARETNVLPAEDTGSRMRVDFIFSFTRYEAQAVERAQKVIMNGYPVKFASCEDVIIHKMIAARAIDEEDVKSIIIKNKDSIDLEYTRRWLSEFGNIPEHKEMLSKFESLLKE